MNWRVACIVWGLVAAAPAQTYIVDGANGPGTNFPDIASAIQAVPDGAVLRVRPGNYGAFFIDGKGLTVLADPGAQLTAFLGPSVANLSPQQRVVIRGFVMTSFFGSAGTVIVNVQNCLGPVALEGLSVSTGSHRLVVQQCASVSARGCLYHSAAFTFGSDVTLTDCTFAPSSFPGVITQQGGRVQLTNTHLASIATSGPAGPCVTMTGGDLRVLGTSVLDTASFGANPGPAVAGSGTLRIDPSVTVNAGATPFAAGIAVTTPAMPHVTATLAPLGGTLTAALHGPLGSLGALSVALPGVGVVVPPFADPIYWDFATAVNQAIGVPASGQAVTSQIAVPVNPVFVGFALVYHGFTWEPAGGLQVSNPVTAVVY